MDLAAARIAHRADVGFEEVGDLSRRLRHAVQVAHATVIRPELKVRYG